MEAPTCFFFPPVNIGESYHTTLCTIFQSNLGSAEMLTLHFANRCFSQGNGASSRLLQEFISSVCIWGFCWDFIWRPKSLVEFEEPTVESTCMPFGLAFCVFFVVYEKGVEGLGGVGGVGKETLSTFFVPDYCARIISCVQHPCTCYIMHSS